MSELAKKDRKTDRSNIFSVVRNRRNNKDILSSKRLSISDARRRKILKRYLMQNGKTEKEAEELVKALEKELNESIKTLEADLEFLDILMGTLEKKRGKKKFNPSVR